MVRLVSVRLGYTNKTSQLKISKRSSRIEIFEFLTGFEFVFVELEITTHKKFEKVCSPTVADVPVMVAASNIANVGS